MNEVSGRQFAYFQAATRAGWISLDDLLEGSTLDRKQVLDPSKRINWSDWVGLCDRFSDLVGAHRLREAGQFVLEPTLTTSALAMGAAFLSSPRRLFGSAFRYGLSINFRNITVEVTDKSKGQFFVNCELLPEQTPSYAWFEMLVGAASWVPEQLGMPVHIEATVSNRQAVMLITPEKTPPFSRIVRRLRAFVSPANMADEFDFQASQLTSARQELDRRERTVFEMLAHLPAAVVLFRDGRILYANPAFSEVVSLSPTSLLGQDIRAFVVPEDLAMFNEVLVGSASLTKELRFWRGNEERVVRASPLENVVFDGEETRGLFAEDITDKVRAKKAAHFHQQTLTAMSRATTDIIARVASSGELLDYFGDGGRLQAGGGKPCSLLTAMVTTVSAATPRHHSLLMSAIADVLASQQPVTIDLNADDGSIIFELVITPIADISEVIVVARDITERRRGERALAVAERMASLGTLASGLGHEINNPLSYVLLNQERLLELVAPENGSSPIDSDEVRMLATETLEGAARMRDLVRALKAFSRVERSTSVVQVEEVIAEALGVVGDKLRQHSIVETQLGDVGHVRGDKEQLVQVFVNLLTNARQSLFQRAEDNHIVITTRCVDNAIVATVRDNGEGIVSHRLSHVFDPFYTTRPTGQGKGLGLAVVHRAMAEAGGSVVINSQLAVGTEVTLTFVAASPPVVNKVALGSTQRHRVLIIDDEPVVARAVARALTMHDATVVLSGEEAIATLEREAMFDAIICDMNMPGRDGVEVYQLACARQPALARRFLFVTAGVSTERCQSFLDYYQPRVMSKPMAPEELRVSISEIVAEAAAAHAK